MRTSAAAPAGAPQRLCGNCRHFRGTPTEVEAQLRGMRTLGSAYGAVRATDGICILHDRYLSPSGTCAAYEPAAIRI
jgi:hypothetical protein